MSLVTRFKSLKQPSSGFFRIACSEPCEFGRHEEVQKGILWNVSVLGAYVVFKSPLPAVGETGLLSFCLPGDADRISCRARVAWINPSSIFKGCGTIAVSLPCGCGVQFLDLGLPDRSRIEARVNQAQLTSR